MSTQKLSRSNPGPAGTARYRRVVELQGKTQAQIASLCRPPAEQPAIHQYENATTRLTWDRAKQLAAGYYRELWETGLNDRQRLALFEIWAMWFRNAEEFGSEAMKAEAREIRAHMGGAWELPAAGLLTAGTSDNSKGVATAEIEHQGRRAIG